MGDSDALNVETLASADLFAGVGDDNVGARVLGNFEELTALIEEDLDAFFDPPYAKPYVDWCLADHDIAEKIERLHRDQVRDVAEAAYMKAWDFYPNPEFCGLISDDVRTLYALLLGGQQLKPFTAERATWYLRGRVPWGYEGEYPGGQWIIL